ncbi:MAG: 5-(carboxyamino)imidazole ribonucleotide mutase [Dehalococcoidia bacterium]|nr:5-(carboxyamino)imidazole ribonucleotide mutase [Dehalococcoidia bacterium]
MPQVGVVIGSRTDEPLIKACLEVLQSLGIEYELSVLSAHRTPERVMEYARGARERGLQVLIGAAGGAAALPGALASWTTLPVIGVPLPTSELKGVDALHAIAQMPPGIPVACVAVGEWGARNAAYLAAEILGLKDEKVRQAYEAYRQGLRQA